jgi:hypothetical protein
MEAPMRKFFASAIAALTFGTAVVATASPAEAQRYYRRHRDNDGDVAAAAIIAGVAGLALGSALSSSNRSSRGYYNQGYGYDPRYSGYGYGYTPGYRYDPRYDSYAGGYGYGYDPAYRGYGYRTCVRRERAYDQYTGRRITIERRYAC